MKLNSSTSPRLTGDRNQCPTCRLPFHSSRAFDAHRVAAGTHDKGPAFRRRCLSVSEMTAKGMALSSSDFWVTALRVPSTFPEDLEEETVTC